MKCITHMDGEAVGVCVRCGKALCKACAAEEGAGRLVCSLDCVHRLRERRQFVAGCFLLGLGGFLVTASVYFYTHQLPFLAVVIVLYALLCLLVGAGFVSQRVVERDMGDITFEPFYRAHKEIRWRAGVALHAAHRFRKTLVEFLANYSKLGGKTVTISQLEWADSQTRRQTLERICIAAGPIPDWVGSSPEAAAVALDEQIGFAHAVGWTFFAEHNSLDPSYEADQKTLLELISAAHRLDSDFKLKMLNRTLAAKVSAKKSPAS